MAFFFDTVESSGKDKNKNIPLDTARKLECAVCPLKNGGAYHPNMPPWGSSNPVVYFLGEAPGETEDKANRPFIGSSGVFLEKHIPASFKSSYRLNNTVRSRPPANRTPTALELACCRNSIVKDIHLTKPAVIVAVGGTALNWLFDGDGAQDIGKWRGKFFPVNIDGYQCYGYCIYHPSYVIRNQRTNQNGEIYKGDLDYLFEADMKRLFGYIREGNFAIETYTDYMSGIQYTEGLKSDRELEKVVNWLNEIDSYPIVAIDYETTHLRPFYSDAKILSVAIGTDKKTFSFPIDYPNAWNERQAATVKEQLKRFLYNKTTKIAQNAKFELEWSCFFFGEGLLKLTHWEDTQGMAYVLDERKGTHNLDFMIREHFGFWLKKLSNLDRANLIQQPLSKVLPYNALDTKWTYKLYWRLLNKFAEEPKLKGVYDNLITMMMMLTHVQLRGVLFSPSACDDLREEYEGKLNDIEHCIKTSQEADLYKQYTNSVFNPRSPNNILLMFRDVLKQGDAMQTNNKISTDSTVLTKLATSVPFAQMILDHRLYAKKISTYIDPMPNFVMPDGRIHTTYNPYETTTGRLSSDSPNLQNWPSKTGKEPRRMLVAPKGMLFVCCDYGQIEARLIGAASQDKNFCKALWENYDVHMEWAKKIANEYPRVVGGKSQLEDPKALKTFRSKVKNLWVFPAFYGASYKSISAGIGVPEDVTFELFGDFWEQFEGVRKWQRWLLQRYNQCGYVESLFGRRRHAPLTANAVYNSAIQSSASDICVLSMVELNKLGLEVVLNVHDEIGFYVPENELEDQVEQIVKVMTKPRLSWLNIPISVEVKVGENWFEMEELVTLSSTDFYTVNRKLFDFRTVYDR